jgi:hypothetical protein
MVVFFYRQLKNPYQLKVVDTDFFEVLFCGFFVIKGNTG